MRRRHRNPLISPSAELVRAEFDDATVALDEVEMATAIISSGVILNRSPGGGLLIHAIARGRARRVGRFASASDAWQAIDQLDALFQGLVARPEQPWS